MVCGYDLMSLSARPHLEMLELYEASGARGGDIL